VTVIDSLATGRAREPRRRARARRDAACPGHPRGGGSGRGAPRGGARARVSISRLRSTSGDRSIVLPTTRPSTCSERSRCSRRRAPAGARRVVFSSTGGGLYGEAEVRPTPEHSPIHSLAPYGQAKLAAEGYCELYTRLHGLSTVSLRYGKRVRPPARTSTARRESWRSSSAPCATGAGRRSSATAVRRANWVEVDDVVRANLLAADSSATGPINIGSGREDVGGRAARGPSRR